jgi:hypothetical protein
MRPPEPHQLGARSVRPSESRCDASERHPEHRAVVEERVVGTHRSASRVNRWRKRGERLEQASRSWSRKKETPLIR